jgi:transposase
MNQDEIILGVDTHLDKHVGAVISAAGKLIATQSVETTSAGYLQLLAWARSLGELRRAGIEGTATYGAGLTRVLRDNNIDVFEINRPDRATRRLRGKADPTDAESAACAVLSGRATAIPKKQAGAAYAMRAVSVARRSAVKARTQAINQLRGILVSAPQEVRERLLHTKAEACVSACARIRSLGKTPLLQSLTTTLRLLAKRWLALAAEIKLLDTQLEHLTNNHAPRLRKEFGVGAQTAAVLVCVAGDNPDRIKSEAALAALCGVSPLQASSGKTFNETRGAVQHKPPSVARGKNSVSGESGKAINP